MTQLLRKQNRSQDCSLSRIAGGCLCFFAAGCVDSGQLFFLLFCAPIDIKGVCSCLKSSSAEAAGVLSVYKAIDICAQDSAFLSAAHSHQSAPTLLIRAITGSTATVDYFWGASVPNSNEISHHIQQLPYASCDAPSTSGTHFLVICLSLMAAQSHAASR